MLLVVTIAFWSVGAIFAYLVDLLLLHTGPNAWRYMLASGAIPALLVIWGRRSIPESPRWLLAKGEKDKGMAVASHVMEEAGIRLTRPTRPGYHARGENRLLLAIVRAGFDPAHVLYGLLLVFVRCRQLCNDCFLSHDLQDVKGVHLDILGVGVHGGFRH